MALTVLQAPKQPPSFGQRLGEALGSGLEQFAQHKLRQLNQRAEQDQIAQSLQSLGVAPEEAQQLKHLPSDLLRDVISQGGLGVLNNLGPQEAEMPQQEMMDSQMQPEQQVDEEMPESMRYRSKSAAPKQELSVAEKIQQRRAQQQQKLLDREAKKEQQIIDKSTQKYYDQLTSGAREAEDSRRDLMRIRKLTNEGRLPAAPFYKLLKNLEDKFTPEKGAAAGGAIGAALGAAGGAAGGPAGSLTGALVGGSKGAAIGAGIGAAINPIVSVARSVEKAIFPDTEEMERLTNNYIRFMKTYFRGNTTEKELEEYMKTIPSLSQTRKGRLAITNNMLADVDAVIAKNQIAQQVIKENNNRRPADFQEQVEERYAPIAREIAKKKQIGYGYYDLVDDEKLPQAKKALVGSTLGYKGKRYINILTPEGQKWQPLLPGNKK